MMFAQVSSVRSDFADKKLRLFCFAHAGGGAQAFYHWQAGFGGDVEVWPVDLPGRGRRMGERPLCDPRKLVPQIAAELRPLLRAPYALFGHSLGGRLAFELARVVSPSNRPLHLFVAASLPPHVPSNRPAVEGLSDGELLADLSLMGGIPRELHDNAELRELYLPILRADLSLFERCRRAPDRSLPVPITALAGADDPFARPESLEGWRDHTGQSFVARTFPGDHFFVRGQQHQLLAAVAAALGLQPTIATPAPC